MRQLLGSGSSVEANTRTGFSALHVAVTVGCRPMIQSLLDREFDLEAEAQWRPDADGDQNDTERWYEYDEKAANLTVLKSLDKSIHGLLASSGWEVKNQAQGGYKFTPRQLAANRQILRSKNRWLDSGVTTDGDALAMKASGLMRSIMSFSNLRLQRVSLGHCLSRCPHG